MADEHLETLWRNSAHWTVVGFYRCADDPRWWVKKRDGGGWTINVAQRGAVLMLTLMVLVPVVPGILLLVSDGRPSPTAVLVGVGSTLVVGVAIAVRVSMRDR